MDLLQKYTEADTFYELDEAVIETIDSLSPVRATKIIIEIQKAIPRIEKEARQAKERAVVLEAVKEAEQVISSGGLISQSKIDLTLIRELQLLTAKPFLYLFNLDASELQDSELKALITWHIASHSRILARNLLPSPAPSDAPLTIPAISTKDRAAGIIFSEENILASTARRSSGRPTTPTFGSMVAKG